MDSNEGMDKSGSISSNLPKGAEKSVEDFFDELYLIDNANLVGGGAGAVCAIPSVSSKMFRGGIAGGTYPRAGSSASPRKASGSSSSSSSSSSAATATRSQSSQPPQPHTFSECDPSSFMLRVGPNYNKTGTKAPAGPALYDVVGVE